jgi:hypothetical protein
MGDAGGPCGLLKQRRWVIGCAALDSNTISTRLSRAKRSSSQHCHITRICHRLNPISTKQRMLDRLGQTFNRIATNAQR